MIAAAFGREDEQVASTASVSAAPALVGQIDNGDRRCLLDWRQRRIGEIPSRLDAFYSARFEEGENVRAGAFARRGSVKQIALLSQLAIRVFLHGQPISSNGSFPPIADSPIGRSAHMARH